MTSTPDGLSRRKLMTIGGALVATPAFADEGPAARLYRRAVVVDGNSIADPLYDEKGISPAVRSRIRASGVATIKQTLGGTAASFAAAEKEILDTRAAISRNSSLFTEVLRVQDIAAAKRSGRLGIIFSFESASMLEGRPENVEHFAGEGVRVMGLSYNAGSPFGGGTLQPPNAGLTSLGREAVARMVSQGVTIDLSHSNEATGFQALAATRTPMLVTHAGSAAVHPHPRNKSDRLMKAVADSGGVFGVYTLSYLGNYPKSPTIDIYMRHMLHALNVCGEDHVGIGTDTFFMGTNTSPEARAASERHEKDREAAGVAAPEELALQYVIGLNGPDRCEVICRELLRRGVAHRVIEKIMGANFVRVFTQTWNAAA